MGFSNNPFLDRYDDLERQQCPVTAENLTHPVPKQTSPYAQQRTPVKNFTHPHSCEIYASGGGLLMVPINVHYQGYEQMVAVASLA